jgi:drug/metabolite transporter (DMT)-like permease
VTPLLALLASGLWGAADFAGGLVSRRLAALVVVVVSQAIALLGLAVVVVATGPGPWGSYLFNGVACGLVGSVALLAFYRALAIGPMGLVAPVASTGVALPVLAGLVAGESLDRIQAGGLVLTMTGVVLASGPELRAGDTGTRQGLLLALVAAVGFGTVYVLIARGSVVDVGMTLLLQRLTSLVVGAAALAALRIRVRLDRPDLPALAFVGAADVGANAAFAVASRSGLLSVTSVLASLYPVVTALLARQILHERLLRLQLAGVTCAFGGVLVLAGAD